MNKEHQEALVGACEDFLRPHEQEEHDGEICYVERANLLAFLAHRLGVRDRTSVELMIERLIEYEQMHVEEER